MAPKRAVFYTYGNDAICAEVQRFVEDNGTILQIRDMQKEPLSLNELKRLIGHISMNHFLNTFSDSFAKQNLDKNKMSRTELLELMAADPSLIRRPIIKTTRLMTVGCDKRKIAEMLQMSSNGSASNGDDKSEGIRQPRRAEQAVVSGK